MSNEAQHISVCICTFKRPQYLKQLLDDLADQDTGGLFTYSIVIVDNDPQGSGKAVVSEFASRSSVPVAYSIEGRQSIALARNKTLERASGDFIAFIDDDEFPDKSWLRTLFAACNEHQVAGVLGPVKPYFEKGTPNWVIKGKFWSRPSYPTGYVIDWTKGRTGNVLFRKCILPAGEQAFRPQFKGGSDQDFFQRMIERGHVFIWCNEAVAHEVVPPVRWSRSFLLRRALLRGSLTPLHPTFGARDVAKSIVAVPVYTLALPFTLVIGQHSFMGILVRLCDHLGRLLALAGIHPIKNAYVTE